MTKEELEKEKCELLGIIQGKDKVIADLEQENAELKKSIKYVNTICERKSVTNSQLTELAADSSAKLCEAKEILTKILNRLPSFQAKSFDDLYLMNALSQAEQFLSELNE